MAGVHYELTFRTEGGESDGTLSFTVYGASQAEARAWGEAQAWEFIHEKRPTDRALKSLKFAPVADYLVTGTGPEALLFDDARKLHESRKTGELGAFGLGACGHIGRSQTVPSKTDLPPASNEPVSLEKLRAEIEGWNLEGSQRRTYVLEETNWDPGRQALYLFTRIDTARDEWREAIFCRAVNFIHAARIYTWHCLRETGAIQPALFRLADAFCAVGEPLYAAHQA